MVMNGFFFYQEQKKKKARVNLSLIRKFTYLEYKLCKKKRSEVLPFKIHLKVISLNNSLSLALSCILSRENSFMYIYEQFAPNSEFYASK